MSRVYPTRLGWTSRLSCSRNFDFELKLNLGPETRKSTRILRPPSPIRRGHNAVLPQAVIGLSESYTCHSRYLPRSEDVATNENMALERELATFYKNAVVHDIKARLAATRKRETQRAYAEMERTSLLKRGALNKNDGVKIPCAVNGHYSDKTSRRKDYTETKFHMTSGSRFHVGVESKHNDPLEIEAILHIVDTEKPRPRKAKKGPRLIVRQQDRNSEPTIIEIIKPERNGRDLKVPARPTKSKRNAVLVVREAQISMASMISVNLKRSDSYSDEIWE